MDAQPGPPRPDEVWKQPWIEPFQRLRLRRLNTAFLAFLIGGMVCLVVGSFELPPTWSIGIGLLVSLGLLSAGAILTAAAVILNVRMRTYSAILAEIHRRTLEGPTVATATTGLRAPSEFLGETPRVVVDLAPLREAAKVQNRSSRPKMTALMFVMAALGGYLLFRAVDSVGAGDEVRVVGSGILGVLVLMIVVLWGLILYAPDLPTHPLRLEIDPWGLWLTRSRGLGAHVAWAKPGLRLFLIDTRPSVAGPGLSGSTSQWLHTEGVGKVPLTETGAEALRRLSSLAGLQIVELPQGTYGALPFGIRLSLPFGSIVSVISRP